MSRATRTITLIGKPYYVRDIAPLFDIHPSTVIMRITAGWEPHAAVIAQPGSHVKVDTSAMFAKSVNASTRVKDVLDKAGVLQKSTTVVKVNKQPSPTDKRVAGEIKAAITNLTAAVNRLNTILGN